MTITKESLWTEIAYSMLKKRKIHFIELHHEMERSGLEISRAEFWRLISDMQEKGRVRLDDYNYLHPLPESTLIQLELRALLNSNAPQDYIDNLRERKVGLERTIAKTKNEYRQIQQLLNMVDTPEDTQKVEEQSLRDRLINSAFEYIRLCPHWQYQTVLSFVAAEHSLEPEVVAVYVTGKRFEALSQNAPPLTPFGYIDARISAEAGASFLDELQDPWETYYSRDQFGDSHYLQDNHYVGGAGI